MTKTKAIFIFLLSLLYMGICHAQERKIMNRPYIDDRSWHYGFSVGVNWQDLYLAHSGLAYVKEGQVEYWYSDVGEYSPGFSVGVLGEIKLNDYMAFRVIPTIYFGDKTLTFVEKNRGERVSQTIKSTYFALPLDLKVNAPRFNNYRPYLVTGFQPTFDMTVKKGKELLVNKFDCMFEIGIGMDLYYHFFKLNPELKFCFGLSSVLDRHRDDLSDPQALKYSNSLSGVHNRMIVLTFYFE